MDAQPRPHSLLFLTGGLLFLAYCLCSMLLDLPIIHLLVMVGLACVFFLLGGWLHDLEPYLFFTTENVNRRRSVIEDISAITQAGNFDALYSQVRQRLDPAIADKLTRAGIRVRISNLTGPTLHFWKDGKYLGFETPTSILIQPSS